MKKTYKYQLPQNKEVKGFNIKIENGNLFVEVELDEKFEPKDGDFLVSSQGKVFIYCDERALYNDSYCCYCAEYFSGSGIITKSSRYSEYWIRKAGCRYATEQEKANFLERLEKEYHKRWNVETKELEDIRWKPQYGENYWYIDYDGGVIGKPFENIFYDRVRVAANNCFKTKEAARPYADQIKDILKNSKAE